MACYAVWLSGDEVVATDEFDDVLEAQRHVLRNLSHKRSEKGAASVKVCDDHLAYFAIQVSSATGSG